MSSSLVTYPGGRLELPDGWEVGDDVEAPFALVALGPELGPFRTNLTVVREASDADHDPAQLLRARLHELDAALEDHHLVDVEALADGVRLVSLHATGGMAGLVTEQWVRATADGSDVLSTTCEALSYHRLAGTFSALVATWSPEVST